MGKKKRQFRFPKAIVFVVLVSLMFISLISLACYHHDKQTNEPLVESKKSESVLPEKTNMMVPKSENAKSFMPVVSI